MSQEIIWHGMTLEIDCDEEGIIEAVGNQDCDNFEEYLTPYYLDQLQDSFVEFLEDQAKEKEMEDQLSNRADY